MKKYRLKMTCMVEEVRLMPVKDGSALRARLVGRGCHNFISKRSGRVLKATKDQMILMQVWRFPYEKISINMLSKRPGEYMQRMTVLSRRNGEIYPGADELGDYR